MQKNLYSTSGSLEKMQVDSHSKSVKKINSTEITNLLQDQIKLHSDLLDALFEGLILKLINCSRKNELEYNEYKELNTNITAIKDTFYQFTKFKSSPIVNLSLLTQDFTKIQEIATETKMKISYLASNCNVSDYKSGLSMQSKHNLAIINISSNITLIKYSLANLKQSAQECKMTSPTDLTETLDNNNDTGYYQKSF